MSYQKELAERIQALRFMPVRTAEQDGTLDGLVATLCRHVMTEHSERIHFTMTLNRLQGKAKTILLHQVEGFTSEESLKEYAETIRQEGDVFTFSKYRGNTRIGGGGF